MAIKNLCQRRRPSGGSRSWPAKHNVPLSNILKEGTLSLLLYGLVLPLQKLQNISNGATIKHVSISHNSF